MSRLAYSLCFFLHIEAELLIFSVNFPICFVFVCFNRIQFSLFFFLYNFPVTMEFSKSKSICIRCFFVCSRVMCWLNCVLFERPFFHIRSLHFFSYFPLIHDMYAVRKFIARRGERANVRTCTAVLFANKKKDQNENRYRKSIAFIYLPAKALNVCIVSVADWIPNVRRKHD